MGVGVSREVELTDDLLEEPVFHFAVVCEFVDLYGVFLDISGTKGHATKGVIATVLYSLDPCAAFILVVDLEQPSLR